MTKERIEDFREIILPFVKKRLLEINYENLGESDAEEFARDFNEILDLAIKALEQEPTTKNSLGVDCISSAMQKRRRQGGMSRLTDMADDELIDHYFDMAHLSLTPEEAKEHGITFFQDVVMEMAARFARTTQDKAEEAAGNNE